MSSHTPHRPLRQLAALVLLLVGIFALIAVSTEPAWTDDRQLLRFNTAKPFLFLMLDNSTSMTLKIGDGQNWTPGYGDSPGSRFYQAKAALYTVFQNVDDISFGFASYNQDGFRAVSKHWVYFLRNPLSNWTASLGWPTNDATGLTAFHTDIDTNGDGANDAADPIRDMDLDGDAIAFGPHIVPGGVAGTCAVPLTVGGPNTFNRNKIDAFPHAAAVCPADPSNIQPGEGFTTMWLRASGTTYRLLTCRTVPAQKVGDSPLNVRFILDTVSNCASIPSLSGTHSFETTADLELDGGLNQYFMEDDGAIGDGGQNNANPEDNAGLWAFHDALGSTDWCLSLNANQRGNCHPFTGKGWEGNYDSFNTGEDPANVLSPAFESLMSDADPFVRDGNATLASYNTKIDPTSFEATFGRVLDKGDMLPWDWRSSTSRTDMLERMWPGYPGPGAPDFRGASFFDSVATDLSGTGLGPYVLPSLNHKAVIASGESPLAMAINDFRCWFLGQDGPGQGKCSANPFYTEGGWAVNACNNYPEFGCTRNYFVVITDGEDSIPSGEDARADVASMWNGLGNVKTWVLNVGAPGNQPGKCNNSLETLVNPNGNCVNVSSYQELRDTLANILGIIRSETRAFASAAVPSVQAAVAQSIYVSAFTPTPPSESPLGTTNPRPGVDSVWDGHLNAFLKPLPIIEKNLPNAGKPDVGKVCNGPTPMMPPISDAQCWLWDAAAQMKTQIGTDPNFLDDANGSLRRVYYAKETAVGTWNTGRLSFDQTADGDSPANRYDFWRGLGVPFVVDNPSAVPPASPVDQGAQTAANDVVVKTYSLKVHDFTETVPPFNPVHIENILGDVFHSNPLIVGNPQNTLYYAADIGGDGLAGCALNDHGYQCFENASRNRRKVLLVGSNDGILHAFDAGMAHLSTKGFQPLPPPDDPGVVLTGLPLHVEFDTGTGKEIWAYVPRGTMGTVRKIAQGTAQQWGVDGSVAAGDAFIDFSNNGTPVPTERRWRTVAIGGLREGGRSYYALDITQPDALELRPSTDDKLGILPTTDQIGGVDPGSPGPSDFVPTCLNATTAACEDGRDLVTSTVPYPSPLWEFFDSPGAILDSAGRQPGAGGFDETTAHLVRLDEDDTNGDGIADGNGEADLGYTWSVPNIGRIRVSDGSGNPIDKYVTIFGGGMDPNNQTAVSPAMGNWIYIVDIETGKAIYKRQVEGPVPAEPAAVDTNQDGYLDRIYFGTTAGFMYRIDLNAVADLSGVKHFPQLEDQTVTSVDLCSGVPCSYTVSRIQHEFGGTTPTWVPYKIFNANVDTVQGITKVRPIYHRPSVIFVAQLSRYALAFGTGDRENLWSADDIPGSSPSAARPGRFFIFVDDTADQPAATLPFTEADFTRVNSEFTNSGNQGLATNFLTGPAHHRGWYMVIEPKPGCTGCEAPRVITNAFALSGIVSFSTYEPRVTQTAPNGNTVTPSCSTRGNNQAGTYLCGREGDSRIFVTFSTNGDTVLKNESSGADSRYLDIGTFVTEPYTEQGQNKNPNANSGSGSTADNLDANLIAVMEKLKTLFPANCKFANYRIDIKSIVGDTGIKFIAPVPICIVEKNWKEF
jgi:hypothetical protein